MTLHPEKTFKVIFARTITLVLMIVLCNSMHAAIETATNRVSGTQVATGAVVTTVDNKYSFMQANSGTWYSSHFQVASGKGRVRVGVDHSSTTYVGADYDYTFYLKIEYKDTTLGAATTVYRQLTVNYDYDAGASYDDEAVYEVNTAKVVWIRVTVDSIRNNLTATYVSTAANNMYVEAITEVQRFYYIDYSTVPSNSVLFYTAPNTTGYTDTNEVRVEWNYLDGAEEYDLEWTYVNDYNSSGTSTSVANLYYDFNHNSTRVTTTGNSFHIPLLFDQGWLLFRVRAVGRAYDGSSGEWKRVYGRWTSDAVGSADTIDDYPSAHRYQITAGHHRQMNWQYISTFAENGKKKEVMSYYDGSLRNRQTVTKTSTDKKVIVGETFYDFQGRPAVTALPAPVPGTDKEITFYPGFNRNDSTAGNARSYNRFNFDKDISACASVTRPMGTASGASYYYSAMNADTNFQQGWIASAAKYPFAQVEYMPDNTGRVRRQGGVGPDHQLGSNHETRYYYGQPFQEELDRIFGSEAGYKKHYNKTVTVDANGQASVSYMDQEGRVVATALAGVNPYNLIALDNGAGTPMYTASQTTIQVDLLAKDSANAVNTDWDDNIISTDGKTLSLNTQLTVVTPQTYEFSYDFDGAEYDPLCLPSDVCYECVYDMTIEIRDQCGTVLYDTTKTVGHFDTVCSSAPASLTISPPAMNVALTQGVYTVTKTLSINEDTLEAYWQDFLDRSTCMRSEQSFIDSALAHVDTSGCHISCDTCGDYEYISQCETSYKMMLSDVSPGGQYAEFTTVSPAQTQFPLSVLNDDPNTNYLPMADAHWRHPLRRDSLSVYDREDSLHYFTPADSIVRIPLVYVGGGTYNPPVISGATITSVNGIPTVEPQELANLSDFVLYWQDSWAKSLVIYHPEYVYYQWCFENTYGLGTGADTMSSDEYDSLLIHTDNVADAHRLGLLDPLGNAFASPNQANCRDPYFRAAGLGAAQYNQVSNPDACEYSKNYQGNSVSMWKMAKIITSCGTIYGANAGDVDDCLESHLGTTPLPTNDTAYIVTDADWLAFRGLYISLKQHFQSQAARDTAMYNQSLNACIGNSSYNLYTEGMLGYSWSSYSNWGFTDDRDSLRRHPCGITWVLYTGKIKRFPSEKDIAPGIAAAWNGNPNSILNAQPSNYSVQVQNGQCPNALVLQSLFNNLNDSSALRTTDSLYHYPAFSLALHQSMAGTSPFEYPIWTPSGSGAALSITFGGSGVSCPGGMTLRFPAGSYTWAGYNSTYTIDRFYNMQALDADSFSVIAAIDHDMNATTPAVDVVLNGSSGCFDISCSVPTACTPSGEAYELFNLMNLLAVDSAKFYSSVGSGYRLDTGAVGAYFNTTQLRNRLGPGTFYWYRVSSTSFKIWNGSGAYNSLVLTIPSMVASVDYFANLQLVEADSLGLVAYQNGIPTNIGIEARWYRNIGSPSDGPIDLGACGSQVPSICVGDEFQRRDDLENLLDYFAVQDLLKSPTPSGTTLDTIGVFTSVLEAPLGFGHYRWIGNRTGLDLNVEIYNTDSSWTACNLDMTLLATPPSGYTWADVVNISGVWADEANLTNGIAYGFTGTAWFPGGSSVQFEGTSCWALRNCNQCISNDGNLYQNFENFNSSLPGFTTTLTHDATCPSTGEYTVTDSASVLCSNNALINGDHTMPNAGSYYYTAFSSNGAQTLWSDTTTVSAYTAYNFAVWYMDADTATNTHVTLELWVDGSQLTSVAVTDNPGTWKLLTARWNGTTSAGNKIIQVKTSGGGSVNTKLAIDDIAFYTIGCEPAVVLQPSPTYPWADSCRQHQVNIATLNGQNAYQQYLDSTEQDFKAKYIAYCMGNAIERFNVEYVIDEYQYTLYYYDQGGNLVKTVPPAGVNIIDLSVDGQDIKDDRAAVTANPAASKTYFTAHTMATTYTYNTLNQLVQQVTPDGDTTRFWYDALGRIVLSQNAKQEELISSKMRYSYTKYDEQGRIEEVGEISTTNNILTQTYATQQAWLNDANFPNLVDGAAVSGANPRYQVTKTFYDATVFSGAAARMPSGSEKNLRKRVVTAAIYEVYTGDSTKYVRATHYSYDIHGNVQEMVQEDSTLRSLDDILTARYQSYKTFEYSYDLVSGNVNMMAYQHGQADAFYYKYEYDADNRVTAAYTHAGPLVSRGTSATAGSGASALGVTSSGYGLWDRDAKYFYYQHGPLARTETGHNKVQAQDYAYTLHGWIKGVNSNALIASKDMGNDSLYMHKYIAADEYGYQLTYYDSTGVKDYTSITNNPAFSSQAGSSLASSSYNLFNGNIKNMITSIGALMPTGRPQARAFTYDQLNRIKIAQVDTNYLVSGGSAYTWGTNGNVNSWKETFIYDNNGNILTLVRHGKSSISTEMDSLTYNYISGKNQLEYVDDAGADGNYGTDIDGQAAGNYTYDKIGNLVSDDSEEIDSIVWNVYGKIERVVRTSASGKSDLEFHYDAMGNRVLKIVKPRDGAGIANQDEWTYTYYVRDASGNVIAVYDRDYSTPGATYTDEFSMKENHLYGSSRVGIRTVDEVQNTVTYTYSSTNANGTFVGSFSSRSSTTASTTNFTHELKRKAYEMSNHLGNVLVTVSDARTANNSGGTVVSFNAVVISATDYYAFGSPLPGRSANANSFRYGFNGKEEDAETNLHDFGARIYNAALGRFLSVDPDARDYTDLSPYCFAANCPIKLIDEDGRGPIDPTTGKRISSNVGNVMYWGALGSWSSSHPGPYCSDPALNQAAKWCEWSCGEENHYGVLGEDNYYEDRLLSKPYYTFITDDKGTRAVELTEGIRTSKGAGDDATNFLQLQTASNVGTYAFVSEDWCSNSFTVYTVQDGWISREAYFEEDAETGKFYRSTEKIYTTTLSELKSREVVTGTGAGTVVNTEYYYEVTSQEQVNYYDKDGNITSTENNTYSYEIDADE